MKQTITYDQAEVLSIFEDVYTEMVKSGEWFDEDGEAIEEVKEGIWTENSNAYYYASTFAEGYAFFQKNKDLLKDIEINELNDYIYKLDEAREVVFETIIRDNCADELAAGQPWDEVADMIEFWEDKDGNILLLCNGEGRDDAVRELGYASNGEIWLR